MEIQERTGEMRIRMKRAGMKDAPAIHELKRRAFLPLLEKYRDFDTSPANEPLEKTEEILAQDYTEYFLFYLPEGGVEEGKGRLAGAARIGSLPLCTRPVCGREEGIFRIAPFYVDPEFQNQGLGKEMMSLILDAYPEAECWRLDTLLQEARNCHFYESLGFVRTGEETTVNEFLTLVGYERRRKAPEF